MLTRRSLLAASIAASASVRLGSSARGDELPTGTIKFIVSFPAGGSTDVVMRVVAMRMQARIGNAVVVENKPGAGGVIATNFVAKATPDGATLLASPSSLAANPTLYKSMPFDTMKDLQIHRDRPDAMCVCHLPCAGGAGARHRRQAAQADVPARLVPLHRRADLG